MALNAFGVKVARRDFKWRCATCSRLEPGWIWLPGGDYVQCPNCKNGFITGVGTRTTPTRKIILPHKV